MVELRRSDRPVETVFDLLGRDENAVTFSIGWGLYRSRPLLESLFETLGLPAPDADRAVIHLQRHKELGGITDIEIYDVRTGTHVIIEAKKGWKLPRERQLKLYAERLRGEKDVSRLVVLTQQGEESLVHRQLGESIEGVPIRAMAIGDVAAEAARLATGGSATSRDLRELANYLRGASDMRDLRDNRVYVVALGKANQRFLKRERLYWFPAAKNWPNVPPNYMGFRYGGRLQAIHHVDGYSIETDAANVHPEIVESDWAEPPRFVLQLGEPIPCDAPTGSGLPMATRCWVDLDLLLTAPSISQALLDHRKRHAAVMHD